MKASLFLSLCLIVPTTLCLKCGAQLGCGNSEIQNDQSTIANYWVVVGELQKLCSTCICREVKKYTNSCIVAINQDKTKDVKKSVFRNQPKEVSSESGSVIIDVEVELSENEAKSIECGEVPDPTFNEDSGTYSFPGLKYVHYYYVENESFCCEEEISVRKLNPSCVVKYDDRCRARIVQKENSSKLCGLGLFGEQTESVASNNSNKKNSA